MFGSKGPLLWLDLLSCLECAVNAASLPLSVVFFVLVARTQILHRNLRSVLLAQCTAVLCYAAVRIAEFAIATLPRADNQSGSNYYDNCSNCPLFVLFTAHVFAIVFNNWLGLILFCERVIATRRVESYEQNGSRMMFIVSSFSFTIVASAFCLWVGVDPNSASGFSPRQGAKLFALFALASSCLVLYLWRLLYRYNFRRYSNTAGCTVQGLSERYQLSENIRTFRQLLPTLVAHFFNDYLTIGAYLLLTDGLISADGAMRLVYLLFSVSNVLMQIAVLILHPILKRTLSQHLRQLSNFVSQLGRNRVHNGDRVGRSQQEAPPTTIDGHILVLGQQDDAERHFKMLENYWRK